MKMAHKFMVGRVLKTIPWENRIHRAKPTFKMLSVSWNLVYFEKSFRSFNAESFGSVGQRAAKLLAVKVGVLKKKSAA